MEAIRVLQTLDAEQRQTTAKEQEILSRYVGWGGIPQAFDESNAEWSKEYAELQSLLTADEYKEARASTLNAFYTSPTVIKAMYEALGNMGLSKGNVLEPSCGVGNFMGLVPDSMEKIRMYGVELDSISGRIAQQLYQKNKIAVQGFETMQFPDSFFDCVVGNVPFGNYKVPDKRYDRHNFLIHDYFITVHSRLNHTKALDATYIFLNFNLSHLLYLLLLLDFFQVSAQCILPSRKRSKACLHQLALIQTTIERTSSFAQTILRRGHWQDFRLPSSLTVDFFVKSYQLM